MVVMSYALLNGWLIWQFAVTCFNLGHQPRNIDKNCPHSDITKPPSAFHTPPTQPSTNRNVPCTRPTYALAHQ